jgi:Ca2+-binding RTX toxin-like protein
MATIIENVVEPVIEDPVIDILADFADKGSAVASLVPALKLGPINRHGRPHQSGDRVLPEERFSDASGASRSTADPGRDTLPELGNFSFPPRSGTIGEAGSDPGPSKLTSYRSSPPPQNGKLPSNDGTDNSEDVTPDTSSDSDDETPPNEVLNVSNYSDDETPSNVIPDESRSSEYPAEIGGDGLDPNEASQPGTVPGATVFGTEGDDIIDVQFVFPVEVWNEPGTLNGTTHNTDVVTGNGGDDAINGGGGGDVIDGDAGDDTLNGEAGDDTLAGGSGDDTLDGGSGDDALDGGGDDDILIGGAGNDELTGGGGNDQLIGGVGADRFVFDDVSESPLQAPDLVFDFSAVQGDQIDVSGIDAISGTIENDEFIFVGDDAFSGSAGELRFVQDLADGLVEGDINGDATADFTIELLGVTSLTGDDIIGL